MELPVLIQTHTILAGNGEDGNKDGKWNVASFAQPMGITAELDTLFVTDRQTGCIKVLASMSGTAEFLQQLRKLHTAFGVHIKNTPPLILSLADAIVEVDSLLQYLKSTVNDVIKGCTQH